MNERLFARLAARLVDEAVVLASVLETRGATPRKRGARMLVTAQGTEASVGGGLAEARVVEAARTMLIDGTEQAELLIDLSGGPEAAGVCGGRMRIGLRRWQGAQALARARSIADCLAGGAPVELQAEELGGAADVATPDDRLLIVGAGHCGLALLELAAPLDFDRWIFSADDAPGAGADPGVTWLVGDCERLAEAVATQRRVHAVLLNRDFHADVAALRALAASPPPYISMMGSRRRIAEVRAALPHFDRNFGHLQAPVGIEIGAETPHEIAVSILAQLIAERRNASDA